IPASRQARLTLPNCAARWMTCSRRPCTFSSRVIGRSSQSGSPATGWFTLGTIGQMALTVSGRKCQHYSGSGHSRGRASTSGGKPERQDRQFVPRSVVQRATAEVPAPWLDLYYPAGHIPPQETHQDAITDGFFATFNGPAPGLRRPASIANSAKDLWLHVRAS